MTTTAAIKPGDTVTGKPVGRQRRQTIVVDRSDVELGMVFGRLVSKKWPGNFRGYASMWVADVENVQGS